MTITLNKLFQNFNSSYVLDNMFLKEEIDEYRNIWREKMTKYKVGVDLNDKETKEPELEVTYYLKQNGDYVFLCARNNRGQDRNIIRLNPDGTFSRWATANMKGLTLNLNHQILEKKVKE